VKKDKGTRGSRESMNYEKHAVSTLYRVTDLHLEIDTACKIYDTLARAKWTSDYYTCNPENRVHARMRVHFAENLRVFPAQFVTSRNRFLRL